MSSKTGKINCPLNKKRTKQRGYTGASKLPDITAADTESHRESIDSGLNQTDFGDPSFQGFRDPSESLIPEESTSNSKASSESSGEIAISEANEFTSIVNNLLEFSISRRSSIVGEFEDEVDEDEVEEDEVEEDEVDEDEVEEDEVDEDEVEEDEVAEEEEDIVIEKTDSELEARKATETSTQYDGRTRTDIDSASIDFDGGHRDPTTEDLIDEDIKASLADMAKIRAKHLFWNAGGRCPRLAHTVRRTCRR